MGSPASTFPNVGEWVALKWPHLVGESKRYYGYLTKYDGAHLTVAFPIRKAYTTPEHDPESYEFHNFSISDVTAMDQHSGPVRAGGSAGCRSGSLQSGGNHAYCTCNGCF